jgi:23S rRNA-intervening sequence protein
VKVRKGRKGERANKLGTELDTSENDVMKSIKHFRDLDVYQGAMALVMRIFELAKSFPSEERYALTD